MYCQALLRTITLVGALVLSSFALGYMTVVTPVSSTDAHNDRPESRFTGRLHPSDSE